MKTAKQYDGRSRPIELDRVSLTLVIVGATDWDPVDFGGFVGANLNLLHGGFPAVGSLVYGLVGLVGRYELHFGYQLYAARREAPMPREKAA